MGLFSEMLDEERIRESFQESSKILMITCPGCACESISYTEKLPCRALAGGKDMEHSAIAIHAVRDRWDEILREMGKKLDHVTVAFPCEMFDTDRDLIKQKLADNDTVAILCCSSGYVGIKDMLPDFEGRIIPMMKTTGSFVFRLVKDDTGENSIVDPDSARIVKFSKTIH